MRDGPLFDHTTMGDSGFFMKAVDVSGGKTKGEDKAILILERKPNPGETCMTFWYYMTGSENHLLKVNIDSLDKKLETCKQSLELGIPTYQNDWWLPEQINFDCGANRYQVTFTASNGGDKFSNIAIDDVFFLKGHREKMYNV